MAKSPAAKSAPTGVPSDGAPTLIAPPGGKVPEFGTAKPLSPADVAGDLPRVVNPLARVPAGSAAKRFKLQCQNIEGFRVPLYVLALDAESAKTCFLEASGINGYLASLLEAGATEKELIAPKVVVKPLDD